MRMLATGAEATIIRVGAHIRKHRQVKAYRHSELDRKLRTERMHREANLLEKAAQIGVAVPQLIARDEQSATLVLEHIDGKLLRDGLEGDWKHYAGMIGKSIAALHGADIIHGDLTTSNMLVRDGQLVLIDFGLGYISPKIEDKAVDLHLLRQALESKHYRVAEKCFAAILRAYAKRYRKAPEVLARLAQVEQRGRYKGKEK